MAKHPKLTKVEEDFKKIDEVIKLESKKTSRTEQILELLKLYYINPDSACFQMYRLYGLKKNNFLHSEIMTKVKNLVREYSPKAISFFKLQQSTNLFSV